jgi:hypothetical protein
LSRFENAMPDEIPESVTREKSITLWFDGPFLRIRGRLRDHYVEPDGQTIDMHHYELEARVRAADMILEAIEARALALPYAECEAAAPGLGVLVGLTLRAGFSGKVRELLGREMGCTHLNSLLQDLTVSSLFQGYIAGRRALRKGPLPPAEPTRARTGVCIGYRAGGEPATYRESGWGQPPSRIWPGIEPVERRSER